MASEQSGATNIVPVVTIYAPVPTVRPTEMPPPTDIPQTPYAPLPDVTPNLTVPAVEVNVQIPTTTPVADTLAAPVARTNANIRSGPGLTYPVVDTVLAGTALSIRARTPAGDWLLLDSGGWIYAELVANAPAVPVASSLPVPAATTIPAMSVVPSLPVPAATAIPAVEIPTVAPSIGNGSLNAFTCIGGCATPPDPSCAIKGNVNSSGEKIYHMRGQRDYDRTDIKPEEGDAWFCTPEEAEAAGFRPAKR